MLQQCDVWLVKVKAHVKQSLKKIRIRPVKIRPSAADGVIKKRSLLLKQGHIEKPSQVDPQTAKNYCRRRKNESSCGQKI